MIIILKIIILNIYFKIISNGLTITIRSKFLHELFYKKNQLITLLIV